MFARAAVVVPLIVSALAAGSQPAAPARGEDDLSGRAGFEAICAACHGPDGRGLPPALTGLPVQPPDFTDCSFATREPDRDWLAVAHGGGPARGFAQEMPSFGATLSDGELQSIVAYVRTLCTNDAWPRGELNLPRPLFTEKAYPEDEAVVTSTIDVEGERSVANKLVYEQRFGARNQVEIVVPFGYRERSSGGWNGGSLGDVALGVKRAFYHSLESGTIISVTGEVIFPTGDRDMGFGSGTVILEPFATLGQMLPLGTFVQVQGGAEFPLRRSRATEEGFLRAALGKSLSASRFGRVWSPMVEVLTARALVSDAETHVDLVPQMQVTLNKRQHIMLNVGVRLPMDDRTRDAQVVFYLLWDWFDGGLFEGW